MEVETVEVEYVNDDEPPRVVDPSGQWLMSIRHYGGGTHANQGQKALYGEKKKV